MGTVPAAQRRLLRAGRRAYPYGPRPRLPEQLPRHTRQVLNCLLRARPFEVIHIGPCAALPAPARSAADPASWPHIIAADYQRTKRTKRTKLTALNDLAARGRLEIPEARLPGYSPRLANAPAVIRWRPASPGGRTQSA